LVVCIAVLNCMMCKILTCLQRDRTNAYVSTGRRLVRLVCELEKEENPSEEREYASCMSHMHYSFVGD
jgi:hypothetical protein